MRRRLPEPVVGQLRRARRGWWRVREASRRTEPEGPPRPRVPRTKTRLLVGPANFAGQGWAWGRSAADRIPGVGSVIMAVEQPTLNFPADYRVPRDVYRTRSWGLQQRHWVTKNFSHVLVEAGRPLTGALAGDTCGPELAWLSEAGVAVALVAHGSEIRLPSMHRELYDWSPFDPDERTTKILQAQSERARGVLLTFDGPLFVSTPDLLDFAPHATWLPTVVDSTAWTGSGPVLHRSKPVVLHVPSNPFLKGSSYIDEAMTGMADRGLIEYRRLEGVPSPEMPALVRDADVVVDQVVLGLYSVMAIQGMFAGKVVLAHVAERTRARVPFPIPVVEANPKTLVDAMTAVLDDREGHRALAADGEQFAHRVHSGAMSADVLSPFLTRPAR